MVEISSLVSATAPNGISTQGLKRDDIIRTLASLQDQRARRQNYLHPQNYQNFMPAQLNTVEPDNNQWMQTLQGISDVGDKATAVSLAVAQNKAAKQQMIRAQQQKKRQDTYLAQQQNTQYPVGNFGYNYAAAPGSKEQNQNAATIARVGKQLGASNRDIQIAIMTALQESGLRNLNYGDRDSVGLFQQRTPWGSLQQRMNPEQAARMFFTGGQGGQRGLFAFANRNKMSLAQAAQAVQVSAFPDAYAKWQSQAQQYLNAITGRGPSPVTNFNPNAPWKTFNWQGHSLTFNASVGNRFVGFLNALSKMGYKIKDVGGARPGSHIAGTNTLDLHSMGLAMDINPGQNPVTYNGHMVTNLPPGVGALAAKYGLKWGGSWIHNYKDPMHFSVPYAHLE